MNAYITSPYLQNANYGYTPNFSAAPLLPNFTSNIPSLVPQGPVDSVVFSSEAANGNFGFGVTDVCDCQFGNYAAQDAFIVPAGDQDNPYEGYNATALSLPENGQNPQQALLALLESLGFTPEMLQALQAMGIDLLELIAQANGMENLGSLQGGQELVLPTTMPANSELPTPVYTPMGGHEPNNQAPAAPTPSPTPEPAPAPAPAPRVTEGREDAHSRMGANGGRGPNPTPAPRVTEGREDAHSRMGANGGRGPNPTPARSTGGGGGGRLLVR